MFKYLWAIAAIPLAVLYWLIEWTCVSIHDTFDSIADGAELAIKWMEKLPWPR